MEGSEGVKKYSESRASEGAVKKEGANRRFRRRPEELPIKDFQLTERF